MCNGMRAEASCRHLRGRLIKTTAAFLLNESAPLMAMAHSIPDPPTAAATARSSGRRSQKAVSPQKDDRAHDGDTKAIDIQTRDPRHAGQAEQPATNNGADNAQNDVEDQAFPGLIHELVADEPCDQPEDYPGDDRHDWISFPRLRVAAPRDGATLKV